MTADDVSGEPLLGARHAHRGRVRRPVAATETIVLVGFLLERVRAGKTSAQAVIVGQLLVPVEEVEVSRSREEI